MENAEATEDVVKRGLRIFIAWYLLCLPIGRLLVLCGVLSTRPHGLGLVAFLIAPPVWIAYSPGRSRLFLKPFELTSQLGAAFLTRIPGPALAIMAGVLIFDASVGAGRNYSLVRVSTVPRLYDFAAHLRLFDAASAFTIQERNGYDELTLYAEPNHPSDIPACWPATTNHDRCLVVWTRSYGSDQQPSFAKLGSDTEGEWERVAAGLSTDVNVYASHRVGVSIEDRWLGRSILGYSGLGPEELIVVPAMLLIPALMGMLVCGFDPSPTRRLRTAASASALSLLLIAFNLIVGSIAESPPLKAPLNGFALVSGKSGGAERDTGDDSAPKTDVETRPPAAGEQPM